MINFSSSAITTPRNVTHFFPDERFLAARSYRHNQRAALIALSSEYFFFLIIINKAMNLNFFSHSHHVPLDAWARSIRFSSRLAKKRSRTTRVVKHAVNISHRTSNAAFLLVQTQIVAKTYLDDHKLIHLF